MPLVLRPADKGAIAGHLSFKMGNKMDSVKPTRADNHIQGNVKNRTVPMLTSSDYNINFELIWLLQSWHLVLCKFTFEQWQFFNFTNQFDNSLFYI